MGRKGGQQWHKGKEKQFKKPYLELNKHYLSALTTRVVINLEYTNLLLSRSEISKMGGPYPRRCKR